MDAVVKTRQGGKPGPEPFGRRGVLMGASGPSGRATFAQDRHVVAEEVLAELPERPALAHQLVGEAPLLEGEERHEMAEDAGGVAGIGNVLRREEA